MAHKYLVSWSAPNYRDSKSITVMASTQSEAIGKVKSRLGKQVKEKYLHNFTASNLQTIANWHKKSGSWSVSSKKRVSRIVKTKKALKRKSYRRK